ncbi:dienelactone hydrolase family protein [Petrotoga sp. 9PWA.NaAc.5.4]|uniref:dienelactone hydrolase family protein n=1 Tax=Petrotoga sp. 9PWA.NaAc.5.4 TaxID=1434328 RepID=UPI000CC4BA31|nr:dienelactone hydrolase family protein [Petrotoga sp. 9PWA.NaAc.5.4]PNR94823.1 hypothetical protein X924_05285 [Petrotoga sp. 9PWA.NaAc.5.4]
MSVNFNYVKKEIDFSKAYLNKGKMFKESLIKFDSLYSFPKKGTKTIELYLFEPKQKAVGSVLILHGLGTKNITYILRIGRYFSHLGVRAIVPILPDNYTRTSDGSTSGKNYFSDSMEKISNTWEHAVVDILTILDFLKAHELWHEKNCLIGYCLGGMISVIVNALSSSINHNFIIASGGNMAELIWHSPTLEYARRELLNNKDESTFLDNKDLLIKTFNDAFKELERFRSVDEILNSNIHPLLKVDPAIYAKFVPREKVTFLEAAFDMTLPKSTRKILWLNLGKPNKIVLPIDHISWLPFQRLISNIIVNQMKFEGIAYQFINLKYIAKFEK